MLRLLRLDDVSVHGPHNAARRAALTRVASFVTRRTGNSSEVMARSPTKAPPDLQPRSSSVTAAPAPVLLEAVENLPHTCMRRLVARRRSNKQEAPHSNKGRVDLAPAVGRGVRPYQVNSSSVITSACAGSTMQWAVPLRSAKTAALCRCSIVAYFVSGFVLRRCLIRNRVSGFSVDTSA